MRAGLGPPRTTHGKSGYDVFLCIPFFHIFNTFLPGIHETILGNLGVIQLYHKSSLPSPNSQFSLALVGNSQKNTINGITRTKGTCVRVCLYVCNRHNRRKLDIVSDFLKTEVVCLLSSSHIRYSKPHFLPCGGLGVIRCFQDERLSGHSLPGLLPSLVLSDDLPSPPHPNSAASTLTSNTAYSSGSNSWVVSSIKSSPLLCPSLYPSPLVRGTTEVTSNSLLIISYIVEYSLTFFSWDRNPCSICPQLRKT